MSLLSRRSLTGYGSQAAASLANVLIVFACARAESAEDFGRISVAVVVLFAVTTIMRGVFGTTLSLMARSAVRVRRELSYAIPCTFVLGILVAAVAASIYLASSHSIWLSLAVVLPLVVVQDMLRFGGVSLGLGKPVLLSDVARVLVSGCAYALALSGVQFDGATLFLSWGVGSLAGALYLFSNMKLGLATSGYLSWIADEWKERLTFSSEAVLSSVASVVYVALLSLFLGSSGVAAIRGAGTVLGPFNVIVTGLTLVVIPQLVVLSSIRDKVKTVLPLAVLLAALALCLGSLGWWVPAEAGALLLGQTWAIASVVLPIMGFEYALQAIQNCMTSILRSEKALTAVISVRLIGTTGMMIVAVVAPLFGDATFVAWGMVINSSIICLFVVVAVSVLNRRQRRKF